MDSNDKGARDYGRIKNYLFQQKKLSDSKWCGLCVFRIKTGDLDEIYVPNLEDMKFKNNPLIFINLALSTKGDFMTCHMSEEMK